MQQRTKIAIAVAVALHSMAAYAQQDATTTDTKSNVARVEVTGTRIRQVDIETAQPVQVMTAEQIQKAGLVTVGDIVNSLSSTGTPAFSKGSTLTSNREEGGQFTNMRNLGGQRVLVLVNGKRWTQTAGGYTDMSTIPSSMIERVEVSKDGGSSVYGSDAIAGVVNFILKKNMEGGTASAYHGQNDKGDGKTNDISLTYGTNSDKGSIVFGLSHTDVQPVWAKSRPITATSFGPGHLNAGFGTGPWGRIFDAKGTFNKYLNHTGSYNGDGTGSDSRNIANYHDYKGVDADVYNSTDEMMATMGSQQTSIFTKGSLELPHSMRLTTTAMFADRESKRQVAGYPLTSTSQPKYPVYLDKDSYYNPLGNQGVGVAAGAGIDLSFARRTIEVPRVTDNTNHTLHIDATLEGEFAAFGKTMNWDVGYNHSAVNGTFIQTGNLNLPNLKKALGPSFKNASGQVQCGTPTAPIAFADCIPWDIAGGPSASNQQVLNYVMATGQGTYGSGIDSATANLTGELFNLPAGAIGFAVGAEHRTATGIDRPGQYEQSGLSTDLAGATTSGKYTVKEEYVELSVPLLKGLPMAELLSIDVASRHSDYSNFGTTTNSKGSFMYRPIKDLLARGTYAQGFRAPTISDIAGGGSQTFDSFLDPCDSVYGAAASDATVKGRCAAAGAGGNFRQLNQGGNPVSGGGAQGTVPFYSGVGNTALQPETATTKTFGLVYSPSWLSGFSATIDYFDIAVHNRITGVSAAYELGQCYVQGVQSFCDKFTRDKTTGQIASLNRGNANLGELRTKGFDLDLSYRFKRTAFGQFTVRSDSTYVDKYSIKSTPTSAWINYSGEWGTDRLKSNLHVDWNFGNWSATWTSHYYSKLKDRCWSSTVECNSPGLGASFGTNVNRLGSETFHDLSVAYAFPWNGKLMVGANNLLDKAPRLELLSSSSYGGTSSSSAVNPDRPIDRFVYVRYNQSF